MGQSKTVFLKRKELSDKLAAVTSSDWFKECLAFAMAEFTEGEGVTTEHLAGIRKFQIVLMDLPEDDSDGLGGFPSSGLIHDLDNRPRELKQKKAKK
jgi:hypothetical protein